MSCWKSGNEELDKKLNEWLKWDKNPKTLSTIKELISQKNVEELSKIMLKRLSFGTAGLRGVMSAGYGCMNDLVIIQTGQGFLKYLEDAQLDLLRTNGIVVGYDGRHNSRRWAELTATIFINAGYKVYLFSILNPTPFVPFAVKKYHCASGVMVTASHNPKDDNGYKVYGSNSCQIVSPVDKHIQQSILNNLEPLESSWDTSVLSSTELLEDPLQETLCNYLQLIDDAILPKYKELNLKKSVLFTYTPMHGVGQYYIEKLFDLINVKMVPVAEQKDPHPDFPTVRFPNPEEGKSSLDLAIKTANENNSPVIIANDPDADRFAVAEKTSTGGWKVFTGNELGALFGFWMLNWYKTKYNTNKLDDVYMISSTVSSMILRTISQKEGFNFIETLTGFKWIGNKALELEQNGKHVIFCYEEAIGFMCGNNVLDKDGISAAAHFTTFVNELYSQGKTIAQKLEEIYNIYGYHVSCNSYYICHDGEKIKRIFERIRNYSEPNTYPTEILNGKYKITSVRDLTTGYDSNQKDKKAILPVSKDTQMITFNFNNGLVCTLRTSGTEPKIKYYTELCASPDLKDTNVINQILNEMVKGICDEFLQPEANKLISRPT